jgi:hypothetical protein
LGMLSKKRTYSDLTRKTVGRIMRNSAPGFIRI